MPIHNINLLQNPIDINTESSDLSYTFSKGDKYLVQTLANLGQREGIKGDSIKYSTFNFLDVFNTDETDNINIHDFIGKIEYLEDGKKCKFSITDKATLLENKKQVIIDAENNIYANNNIELDIKLNNIDLYSKDSALTFNDNYFISLMFGKIIGTAEDDANNQEIIYNKFNSVTNELEFAVRAYYLYNDLVSNYYLMFTVEKDMNSANIYKMHTYLFNSSVISNDARRKEFEDAFNFLHADNQTNSFLNQLKSDFTNVESLFYYKNEADSTLFGMFKYNELNNELNKIDDEIILNYNNESNELLSIADESNIEYVSQIFDKSNLSLLDRISFINKDIIYLYPVLLKYYSNEHFTTTKQTLVQTILYNIYNYINKYNDDADIVNCPLYVPLTYKFKYTCNSNNELNIFDSTDIFIELVNLNEKNNDERLAILNAKNVLIYNYTDVEKITNVCFIVNYNSKYSEYISNISVLDIYTLPFISEKNTWNINNIDTKISALGKDAGNPNIIMIYNYKDNNNKIQHKLLSGSNLDKVNSSEFKTQSFNVSLELFKNVNKETGIKCYCDIPIINKSNIDIFKYTTLIVLSDKSCLDNKAVESYTDMYSSIWTLNNENNELKFEYITTNDLTGTYKNDVALDVSYLLNVKNIIDAYLDNISIEDNKKFNTVLIDANQYTKNQETTKNINNCAAIKNEYTDYYKETFHDIFESSSDIKKYEETFNYKNNLNLNIRYGEYDFDINNVLNPEHYINGDILFTANEVTNTPYPIYNKKVNTIIEKFRVNTKYKYNDAYKDVIIKQFSLKPNEIGSVDSIVNKYDKFIYPESSFIEIENLKLLNTCYFGEKDKNGNMTYFYNEYLPNKNVPLLDLKEVLLTNSNTLNRVNILSLDKNGEIYNSYIGTRFDINSNKENFVIGSSNRNINVGTNSLISYLNVDKFKTQKTIDIDFNKINLNGNVNISNDVKISGNIKTNNIQEFSAENIVKKNINNIDYYTVNISLSGIIDTNIELSKCVAKENSQAAKFNDLDDTNYTKYIDENTRIINNDMCIKFSNDKFNIDSNKDFIKLQLLEGKLCLLYFNASKVLDKYIQYLYGKSLNDSDVKFEYVVNNTDLVVAPKLLGTTYKFAELLCNNYGTLNRKYEENNNVQFITDDAKFIIYKEDEIIHIKYMAYYRPVIYNN